MNLENNERVLLLGLVKEAIRQGQLEKSPQYFWDGKKYNKPRKKYGIKTLTTLYELESKLKKLRVADVSVSDCISKNEVLHYTDIDTVGACSKCGSMKQYEH
jgi:hypothetical protein